MTDEQSQPGDPDGPRETAPDIRVSHADRDQVVDILRDAAGDGRLTAEELDERVEAALTARTVKDLAALTADLPLPPAEPSTQSKDLIKIDQRLGTVERTGPWVVPKRMEIRITAGDVKLDFTEAVINHDQLTIDVDLGIGADLLLVTKPGILVNADDLTVRLGDFKIRQFRDESNAPVVLRVEVTGRIRGGDIVVRPPRRTLGQWMRGESAL